MTAEKRRDRLTILLVGLFLLLAPLLVLVATLEALFLLGEIEFADLSLLEILELYVIDLLVLAVFAYVVYRITLYLLEVQLPEALDVDDDPTDENSDEPR